MCTVLSNGLENAFRAVSGLDEQQRTVSLYCGVRLNKLLLEIKNPYQGEIVMCEGLPVSDRAGHGYGCRSMQAIAARRGGLFELQAENGVFLLRLALPLNG
ncbi:MAG: GHKL domain-containing protein [Acutalibacteraceae bacterium]